MADFIYTGLISGSFFMGAGAGVASKVAEAITLGIMGTEAAADTVVQKMDAGYDDKRAFILGTIAGAAEILTERVSLEALLNTDVLKHGAKGFAQYLLKNAAAEGSEEGFSDLINWFADDLYDVITSQDESEWKRKLRELKEQYPDASDSALLGKAIGQRAAELGLDVAGGALSGALMAGGSSALNLFNASGVGKEIKSMGDDVVHQAVDVGLKNDKNSESYKIATELDAKLKDGKMLTDLEVGQLYQANYAEIEKAEADGKLRLPIVQQKFMNDLQNNINQRILESQNTTQNEQANTEAQTALETQEAAQTAQQLTSEANLNAQENAAQTRTEAQSITESKKLQLPTVKESNNGREVYLRDSSQRADSTNPGEQVRAVEESAGRDSLRQTAAVAKDSGAVNVSNNGEAKSARELTGLDNFDDSDRSFYEATGNLSRDMQSAKRALAALGLNLRIWLGGNMKRLDGASIEGVISGKDVWVRGDHPLFSSSQLAGHEKGHYLIDSGAISSKEMRAIVEQLTSEDFVRSMINEYGQRWNKGRLPLTKQQRAEAIAGLYASAFEGSDLTAEQIWDEIICDSIGNMNRVEGVRALAELKGKADTLLQYTGKEAGKQASRAPPSESRNESGNARYSKDLNERSRALRPGEMVNEYRDKVNWPEYYQKILNAEYNADNFEDGEFATMTLGNSVLTLQMQRNGEWAVVGMEDINERMGNNRKPSENGNQGDRELPAERSRNSGGSDLAQSEQRARNTKKDSNVQNAEGISKDASAVLQRRGSVKRFSREFTPTASDEKYLAAVNSGDMETAQKMVDEAAKAAGYRTERFHGTRANFTQFNPDYAVHGGSGYGYYFGDKELADEFGKGGKVLRVLINDKNIGTLKTHNITAAGFEAALKRLGLSADKTYKYMGADSASKYVKRNHDYRLATDLQYWAVNPRKYAENPNVKQRSPREIITILRDSLGLDGIERGREIVLWDNTLMKLADPVTYDDSGNVIPLSERFNEKNEDIRYSREFDADLFDVEEDNRKRIAELQKELAKARKGELYWKGQTKRTTTKTLREADVNKLAKRLIKNYESTLEAEDIAPKLKALGEYLLNNGDGKNELTYTEFSDRAADIARDIVDSAMAEAEGNDTATLKDIRKYLRSNTLKLPAQNKADMIDYAAFKKANPALKVSTQSGLDVDVAYQEMQEMFGKAFFPDDIINPADQLQRIADVVHSLEPVYENPYNYYKADAIDYISADIVDSLLGESVRQNPPTVMDKAMKAAEEKRARQVQKAIEHGKQRVAEVRAQKNEQLQALKEYYTEQKQNERERRADSQARTKLLKIARRLNNKKLPLVMKNQLAQYIGELDLVAKSMTGKTLDKLTELKKWYENQKAELGEDFTKDDAIEEKLDRLSKKHINDLSAQEVADLTQILQFFEASIIEANKFKNSEVKQDRYAAGMRTVFDVQNARKGKINWQLRPSSAAMRIVGYDETSPIVTLMEEMIEGERQYDLYQREAVKPFEKWINDKKFMKSFSGKDARKLTIKGTDVNGSEATQEITPAMLAEMLLASRNDDNMRHYQAGYAVFPDMKEYRKGNIEEAYNNTNKLSIKRSDILAAAKSLTKAELEYAAEIAKYYNDFAPKRLNETSLVIDGYEKFLEENYYPIVSDNKFLNQDYESLDENGNNAGLARPGFGEKRTHASNPAIVRDANLTLMQQIRMNGRYATMAIPLQNMSRLLNVKGRGMTTSVRETLAKQYSSSADAYLKKFMQDYAGKSAAKERGLDPVLKKVRSKYAGGVLALSAGTAIKQAASYPTAAAITGAKPLLQAMNATLKADTSFIDELTAVYTKRKQGFSSVELGDLASINKSLPKALNWIQAVDVGTTKLLKRAAYFAVKSESPN
ncbi:MAG: hypothetical protein J6X85_07195, partial [Ruminococcus sp.]|nr:hypothetical protein [Ruminococcus sp.]